MGLLPDYSLKDKLWLILMRRWIPALTILIIISILGIVATYKITPIYEAKTKLKFKNVNYNFLIQIFRKPTAPGWQRLRARFNM